MPARKKKMTPPPQLHELEAEVMGRLHQKGLLNRERAGKTDIYSPVMARDAYLHARARDEVDALVDEFGELALTQFAAQIDRLDPARLRALRKIARNE
jgi:predicted transcriptional regulator